MKQRSIKAVPSIHKETHAEFVAKIRAGKTPEPGGEVELQFVPLKPFFSEDFQSEYEPGLYYTVHANNARLRACVLEWQKQKLVRVLGSTGIAQGSMESSVGGHISAE